MVKIPNRLEDLYPAAAVEKLLDALQQPELSGRIKETLGKVGLGEIHPLEQVQQAWQQAKSWLDSLADGASGLPPEPSVLNATGRLLDSGVSHVPVSSLVANSLASASAGFLTASAIDEKSSRAIQALWPAARGAWFINVASALQSVVGSRKVLIAKTDLLRIQGVGDIGVMLQGQEVIEVGATNECREEDWHAAIEKVGESEWGVLLVTPNGMPRTDLDSHHERARTVCAANDAPVWELMADATLDSQLAETMDLGNPQASLAAGSTLIMPLHLLVGAPQGTLVLAAQEIIEPLERSARLTGQQLDGPARMAATVALQVSQHDPDSSFPASALRVNPENLKNRVERLAKQIENNGIIGSVEVQERTQPLGPAPWNAITTTDWILAAACNDPGALQAKLLAGEYLERDESGSPDILPIAVETNETELLINLRYLSAKDDYQLVLALSPGPLPEAEIVDEPA